MDQHDPTAEPLLHIDNLKVEGSAGERWARLIDGISLVVRPGEIVGLVGESGAGKSTLGLAAMGYVRDGCRFAGGAVHFAGTELISASRRQRRALRSTRIAYVAQSASASFNPFYRLIDQCTEFMVLRGIASRTEARRHMLSLFNMLHLPNADEIGFRYPHQVSGGQLQRMMTAMAMACRPELIVFDEPTTALDVTTQVEVLLAIREAVETQKTAAIYITHDLAVVSQMADRVLVLKDGQLVEEGTTHALLTRPEASYTKSLWAVRTFQAPEKRAPPAGTEVLCSVRDLSAGYGHQTVLYGISFDVGRRRTLAIVGESGSGKSTVARCLSGLLAPSAGTITFDGETASPSFRDRQKELLRNIQIIAQTSDMALNPRQSVATIVGRPIRFYEGIKGTALRRRVAELLEAVELDPATFSDRLPGELSGGQKQRVGIARALAARPKMLICDEVISALDQLVAEGILRLLSRLQCEQGLTILFITHDIDAVRAIADDVLVMKDGRIRALGLKTKILTPPHESYVEQLMAAVPEMNEHWLDRIAASRDSRGRRPVAGAD